MGYAGQGFGYETPRERCFREVVLVVGPPLSGKSTYILEHATRNDAVMLNSQRYWETPQTTRAKTANFIVWAQYGSGVMWIETNRHRGDSDRFMGRKVKKVVRMEATKEECLRRLREGEGRRDRPAWKTPYFRDAIEEYFGGSE